MVIVRAHAVLENTLEAVMVLNSYETYVHRIEENIESYGIPIDWTQYDEESLHHPLIKLLINYFRISDEISGLPVLDDENEYRKWVGESIYTTVLRYSVSP